MPIFICQGCGAEHPSWNGTCPDCGTTETIRLAPNTDRMIDRVIKGKFKILKKLGQGGMGAVYLAEQVGIGHRVALKFLRAEFSTDAEIARRFLNEAKSYARVAHPNAVALHDFGQDDEGNLFIAMEYCEGVDLKKVIAEQGRLTMNEAIEVVLQVADVLANAHTKGVIHRDLKPENIMIRRGMRGLHAKVLDFGIARLMDNGTKLTIAGSIAGTPRYMSPEQVEGREVDLRADIYSLGIVLFETLTGRQPFDGATIAEILRKQALDPMPHLTDYSGDLDYPALDAVIQRATAKRREGRWPNMLAFAEALTQGTPTEAHLGLTPLQRSSVLGAMAGGVSSSSHPSATPFPGQGGTVPNSTPSSYSGVAPPGAKVDESSTGQTLMRSGESREQLRPVRSAQGEPGVPPHGLAGGATSAGNLSISAPPAPAPASKVPLIAGLVAVAVLLLGGGAILALKKDPVQVPPPPPVVVVPEPVKSDPSGAALAEEVRRAMREEKAKGDLGRGVDEFEAANFDSAVTFLNRVPVESDFHEQAVKLLAKISTVRELLASGEKDRQSGNCERAIGEFRRALELNKASKDAQLGLQRCSEAKVNPTMEP